MTRKFHMDDCVIAIPDGARDFSMHMLEWPIGDAERLSLVVQRGGPLGTATPEELVARETKNYATVFEGFRMERDDVEDGAWEGLVLHHKAFRWKKDADVFYNHQVYVFEGGRVILFTASSMARHRAEVERLIETVLAELRFRDD